MKPNITYYIIKEEEELPSQSYYAGSYNASDKLNLKILVWNNRWGTTDVNTATNCILEIMFSSIEDSVFLKHLKIKENSVNKELSIKDNKASVRLSSELRGLKHSPDNNLNFMTIELELPIIEGVRESIKNIFLDLDYDIKGSDE